MAYVLGSDLTARSGEYGGDAVEGGAGLIAHVLAELRHRDSNAGIQSGSAFLGVSQARTARKSLVASSSTLCQNGLGVLRSWKPAGHGQEAAGDVGTPHDVLKALRGKGESMVVLIEIW